MAGVALSDHDVFRRGAALTLAILAHALLIAGWSELSAKRRSAASAPAERRSVLLVIDIEPAKTPPPSHPAPASLRDRPDELESTAITVIPPQPASPPTTSEAPRVDWRLEAERSGRAIVEDAARPGLRAFGPAVAPAEAAAPKEFEWDPEPKRAGFAGGLPYVRLGKRCVVGLGFFGCAIGDLPEANGELFEGMRAPNRRESSVPDPKE